MDPAPVLGEHTIPLDLWDTRVIPIPAAPAPSAATPELRNETTTAPAAPPNPAPPDAPTPPETPAPPDAPTPPDAPAPPDAPTPPDAPAPPDAPTPPETPAPREALEAPDPSDPRQPAGTEDASSSTGGHRFSSDATVVIEGDIAPKRLRRPGDLLRLVVSLLAAATILLVSYVASGTTSGLDQDLSLASTRLPAFVLSVTRTIGLIGLLGLPVGVSIFLLTRKRGRQLVDALSALVLTLLLVLILNSVIHHFGSPQLLQALTGRSAPSDVIAINALISALTAFITVARLIERPRMAVAAIATISAIVIANIVGGTMIAAACAISILLGWAFGLLVRYVRGTPTTRPSGLDVANSMERSGFPLTVLRASSLTRGGRRYTATTRSGRRLDVLVLDRDLEGAGLLPAAWRSIRIREDDGGSGVTMRRRLERGSLQAYASQVAGAPCPHLLAVNQVGHDATLMAFETIDGEPFAAIGDDLRDGDLDRAWAGLKRLQDADISHRTLSANNVLRDANGGVWLINGEEGSVAASDLALRLDLAEMLCTQALLTDADSAIAAGIRVLGVNRLMRALPALQPVALSPATRHAIRKRKDLLGKLRDKLLEANPGAEPEQVQIERLKPRTLFTIIAGTVAAYFLLTSLASVNLAQLIADADWTWVIPGLLLSAATYVGAAMSLSGFVPEKLHLVRTMLAQLAASFATLVSPPTLGAVAVNVRYLQRSDVHPALAAASVAVSQVMAFVFHLLLLLGFGFLAGTQREVGISVPTWFYIGAAIIVALLVLAIALPWSRQKLRDRVQPILRQVGPRFLTLTQRPAKLAEGIGGILILNIGYCICLYTCVRAFGGDASWAAVAVVYLAGATIGQAAPTPGGLGAVEAALSVGLTGIGVEPSIAVSSSLLFRVLTFWLPTVPGWFSFNWMQKRGYL
jgi:uncharacterized membrane protein YbhN (UPF0104 family)